MTSLADRDADSALALAVLRALRERLGAGARGVQVDVEDACVSLRGEVDWDHERQEAACWVRAVPGVREVDERLRLRLRGTQPALGSSIERALVGLALQDASKVHASVDGAVVTLHGQVHSAAQREAIKHAIAAAPGVRQVIDELQLVD